MFFFLFPLKKRSSPKCEGGQQQQEEGKDHKMEGKMKEYKAGKGRKGEESSGRPTTQGKEDSGTLQNPNFALQSRSY